MRSIVWDDEAGAVDGDHSQVGWINGVLAAPKPVTVGDTGRVWALSDPGHDPAEFLVLIREVPGPRSRRRSGARCRPSSTASGFRQANRARIRWATTP